MLCRARALYSAGYKWTTEARIIILFSHPAILRKTGRRVPEECPEDVEAMIARCLDNDPAKRPSAR